MGATDGGDGDPAPPPPAPAPSWPPPRREKNKYDPIVMPSPEQMAADDQMNNCAVRTILSCVMGGALGVAFGVFMGTMDTAGPGLDGSAAPATANKQTARQVLRSMGAGIKSRSVSYAKGFALMGALFAGSECVIEKARAKHDAWNAVYAGCAAGGALAAPAGPRAACVGCASFAAFSAFIDRIMGHHD